MPEAGRHALQTAREQGHAILLYDTGGRLQCDDDLVEELRALHAAVEPRNTVLVLDAATGREAVEVARTFHEAAGLTGLILTKLDGDARGGAALSVHAVTGCPILRVGLGEKPEDLEPFHPDRMASRMLGMGDVVSLVEKAQATFDTEQAQALQERLQRNAFDLNDLLTQLRGMQRLGPMDKILEMLPTGGLASKIKQGLPSDAGANLKRTEAIILSMTPGERRHPDRIDGRRRRRIAKGSGTRVRDVNELLKGFRQTRHMMKQLKRSGKRLPGFPG